jgi:hypothetical protein
MSRGLAQGMVNSTWDLHAASLLDMNRFRTEWILKEVRSSMMIEEAAYSEKGGEVTREPHEREGKGMMMMREDRRDDSGN